MLIRAVVIWLTVYLVGLAPTSASALFLRGAIGASGGNYVGPGDITSFTSWWGLRAYSSAQANGTTNIAKIKRASDSTSVNIVALTNGQFDTATASSFCAATTCTVIELYDQVGSNNLSTDYSSFPALVFNCLGTYPCMQSLTSNSGLRGPASITPTNTNNLVQYAVANFYQWSLPGVGVSVIFEINGENVAITHEQDANRWTFSINAQVVNTNYFGVTATDYAWHVGVAQSELSSSYLAIDGAATVHASITYTPAQTGQTYVSSGSGNISGIHTEEFGWVDNTAWVINSPSATACLATHNAANFYNQFGAGITVGGSC